MKLFSKPEVLQAALVDRIRDAVAASNVEYSSTGHINIAVNALLSASRSALRLAILYDVFRRENF